MFICKSFKMKTFLVSGLLLVFAICNASIQDVENFGPNEDLEKIANGDRANIGEFPYSVFMHVKTGPNTVTFCGGILVAADKILTTTSCLKNSRGVQLLFGKIDLGDIDDTSEVLLFEQYLDGMRIENPDSDLTIIKLPHPIAETASIRVASIPSVTDAPAAGTKVHTSGFGKNDGSPIVDTLLNKATGSVVEEAGCLGTIVDPNAFCYDFTKPAAAGVCDNADYGGGVEDDNGVVIGINVFGYCKTAEPTNKNVALNLGAYKQWIDEA